jgi:hypothetical protein
MRPLGAHAPASIRIAPIGCTSAAAAALRCPAVAASTLGPWLPELRLLLGSEWLWRDCNPLIGCLRLAAGLPEDGGQPAAAALPQGGTR